MIECDLYVEQLAVPVRIDLPQGTNVQQIKFSFRDIKPKGTVRIYIKKPSGAEIYNNASEASLNADIPYAVFNTTTQMTAEAGQMQGQVRVTDAGDKILNSFPITLNIIESPVTDNAIESEDEFTALDEALAAVRPAIDSINSTNSSVKAAEAKRVTAEQSRVTAEQGRVTAEQGRVSAEQGRVTAESTRVQNESTRQSNESTRQANEETRQQWYNDTKQEIDNASFTIGTVTTGEAGSSAAASISGSPFTQQLNLTIPKGDKGDKGDPGDPAVIATDSQLGVVKIGNGLQVDPSGLVTAKPVAPIIANSSGIGLQYDSNVLGVSSGKLTVNSGLSNFMGTGRTYYTTGDPMTVTVDMFNHQIIAPCTIINPTTGVIVVDDGQ